MLNDVGSVGERRITLKSILAFEEFRFYQNMTLILINIVTFVTIFLQPNYFITTLFDETRYNEQRIFIS